MQVNNGNRVNAPGVYRGDLQDWSKLVDKTPVTDFCSNTVPAKPKKPEPVVVVKPEPAQPPP